MRVRLDVAAPLQQPLEVLLPCLPLLLGTRGDPLAQRLEFLLLPVPAGSKGGGIGGLGGGWLEQPRQWLGAQWLGLFLGVPRCAELPGVP